MKKNPTSKSGIFNFRVVIAVALCSIGASFGWLSFASMPPTSNITVPSTIGQTVTVTWTGTIPPGANPTNDCSGLENTPAVDQHMPTVTVPAGIYSTLQAQFKFKIAWTPVANNNTSDEILTVFNPDTSELNSSDGGGPSETVTGTNLVGGTYNVVACGFSNAQPQDYTGTLTITTCPLGGCPSSGSGPGPCDSLVFGGPDKTCPGNPRYQNFYAPAGTSAQSARGEFNIGFSPLTHRIMVMNIGPVWRLTPGDVQVPALPECCEALWEDKSTVVLDNPATLDPILWTDQKTGRTFGSNSTAGANVEYAYTDNEAPLNDGDMWVPVGISPPNGGVDHQTIGSGPYPLVMGLPNPLANPVNQGEMVFYISQDLLGSQSQRSDNLGVSYGPGVPSTGPGVMSSQGCGGLHGHVHVAPDGTVWLPDNSCGTVQGGSISIDSGMTWSEFIVEKTGSGGFTATSQTNGADPSIALDAASTAYYCYVNNEANGNEGHVHVATGKRTGASSNITWLRDVDVGASHGIVNAALTEAVGGSAGRAACGFVGTNVTGNYESGSFTGVWYAYIATTYDEGRTWVTVNATPDDPVQNHTGIWQQGGSGENGDRNLLDFNEITVDDKGRVLYGYSDGCNSLTCIQGNNSAGERGGFMRVARQFGGKPLFSQFDPNPAEPVLAKPACLSGTRDAATGSHLTWKTPDNGGSDIVGYQIFRGTTAGGETVLVNNTGNTKTFYNDTTALSSVPEYFYVVKAITTGAGIQSNEVDLTLVGVTPTASACTLPGLTVCTDTGTNDATDMQANHDIISSSVAYPFPGTGNDLLYFTIKVASLSTLNTQTFYFTTFTIDGAPEAAGNVHGVRMVVADNPLAPTFESYIAGASNAGTVDGRFVVSSIPAESGSNYNANGTITIIVKRSNIGVAVGHTLTNWNGAVAATAGGVVTGILDGMPSTSGTGLLTINRNNTSFTVQSCQVLSPVSPLRVVSRKMHGTAGTFDITLPLPPGTMPRGVECRTPGQLPGGAAGDYQLVFTFPNNLTSVASASVTAHNPTSGTGTVSSSAIDSSNAHNYIVNLTGVSTGQYITVTLNTVHDAADNIGNVTGPQMGVLIGDTSANGLVNSTDVSQAQAQSGQAVTSSNFRKDINANGLINSTDVSAVQAKSGTGLPSTP